MKAKFLLKEPLRWFLLLWVAMAVAGTLMGSNMQGGLVLGKSEQQTINSGVYISVLPSSSSTSPPGNPLPGGQSQTSFFMKPILSLPSILIFLLFAALYSFLLWVGLSSRVKPRFFWLYFLFQGLLVLVMQWMVVEPKLTLNLYLVLTLCAVALFKRAVPALLIGVGYLLLFFLSFSISFPLSAPLGEHLTAIWLGFWSFSDLTTIVFFVLGYLMLSMQQSSAQRELEQAYLELQGAHSRLAASSRQIEMLTLLTERQRIARELHDTLAQGIAGMVMQLEVTSAQMQRKNYQQAQQVLDQALSYARTTLQDARRAITDLRAKTPRVDQLVESVQEEIAHFLQTTGLVCHAHLDDLARTPAHSCEHVLRVIGEGLNNVARHAQASQVSVEAKGEEKWLSITVRDDGQGFDPDQKALYSGHYGLLGLQERASLVGGSLSVSSSKGKGTTLEFCLPLTPSDNAAPSHNKQAGPAFWSTGEQSYA